MNKARRLEEVPRPRDIDEAAGDYLGSIVERCQEIFESDLAGVFLIGSGALGDYLPGRSDLDVAAVTLRAPALDEKQRVVRRLRHPGLPCPSRGLEFVLYSTERLLDPVGSGFEINLNTGPRMKERLSFDQLDEPRFWFLLDRAMAREHGFTLFGPPARDLFPPIPRRVVLEALKESLHWHASQDPGHASVLNACRAWRFVEENVWSSKLKASEWARPRLSDRFLIDWAIAVQRGEATATVSGDAVARLLEDVLARVQRAARHSFSG